MPTRSETSKTSPQTATKSTASAAAKDALTLLSEDHRRVERLFSQFESAKDDKQKQQIVQQLCNELTVHAMLEESTFYPPAREALQEDKTDLIDEAKVEHGTLKWLIAQLEDEQPGAELYDAKVTVLKEYVEHHVKEEEKELFTALRSSSLDLAELGETLQVVKQELQKGLTTH